MRSASTPALHLWAPGMFDFKGGIQVYSTFLLHALTQVVPQISRQVFLMHDRGQSLPMLPSTRFHCTGQIPQRVRSLAFAAQAASAGIKHHPNLIITTHIHFTVAAYRLKQLTGIPYWAVAHGFEAWDIQRPILRQALANADRILAVSRYTRDRLLQEQNLEADRVSLLPNTFDADQFRLAGKPDYLLQRYHLTADQPVILTVNRLAAAEAYHPYDRVLAALPQIRQAIPNVHYLIVGQGDDRARLQQQIRQQQLQDCVTLAGFVPDSELADHYNLCDVFAMPSKLEGFGIVFLEAMASGKPVLGSHQDGGMDALWGGQLGALVHPDDDRAIAQTLIQILQRTVANPLLFQPIALRQAVIDRFGCDRFQRTLAQLLQNSPLFSSPPSHHESSACYPFRFTPAGRPQPGCVRHGQRSQAARH